MNTKSKSKSNKTLIPRLIQAKVLKKLKPGQVVVIYGARQVGKTTLLRSILSSFKQKYMFINADLPSEQEWLASLKLEVYKRYLYGITLLVIDEAQRVKNIGLALKIIIENIPNIKVLVSGSSSLDLANKISEPLTGRKYVFQLYPIAVQELTSIYNLNEINNKLEELLLFGQYPKIFNLQSVEDKQDYLYEIAESYLFKDVLAVTNIRKSDMLYKLLQLLAYHMGSEVSANELANNLEIDKKTIQKYLDLLEQTFVIYSLPAFSNNKRKEIVKSRKYYFYDLGIRNALIRDFRPLFMRNDTGALWENFIVNERIKLANYYNLHKKFYFWRTYSGAEIDLVEENSTELLGLEIKFNMKKPKAPSSWQQLYPSAKYEVVNKQNWLDWVVSGT